MLTTQLIFFVMLALPEIRFIFGQPMKINDRILD